MIYKTVKFDRTLPKINDGMIQLMVHVYCDEVDREEGPTTPSANLGCYHFPATKSDEEGFQELIKACVDQCELRIKQAQTEMEYYKSMKLDNSHLKE